MPRRNHSPDQRTQFKGSGPDWEQQMRQEMRRYSSHLGGAPGPQRDSHLRHRALSHTELSDRGDTPAARFHTREGEAA